MGGNLDHLTGSQPCQSCGEALVTDARTVMWCESCEWNIDPAGELAPTDERTARRNEAMARRVFANVADGASMRDGAFAMLLALIPVAMTATLGVFGLALVLTSVHRLPLMVVGVVVLLLAVVSRPRVLPRPRPEALLTRSEAPAVWRLVDAVSRDLSSPPPDAIEPTVSGNASVVAAGLRGSIVMKLSVPFWDLLDPPARVALIAHEMGHVVNRDPRVGRIIGGGVRTLSTWHSMFMPQVSVTRVTWLGVLVQRAGRRAITRWMRLILRLQQPAIQVAELRSDRAAVQVAGWSGFAALMERLRLSRRLGLAIEQASTRTDGVEFFESITTHIATLPPREIERLRRLAEREPYDAGRSHPPERLRLAAVDSLRAEPGRVIPDAETWAAIDRELEPARRRLAALARSSAR